MKTEKEIRKNLKQAKRLRTEIDREEKTINAKRKEMFKLLREYRNWLVWNYGVEAGDQAFHVHTQRIGLNIGTI